jgi:phosphatidylethanolamine N-methyltransferase
LYGDRIRREAGLTKNLRRPLRAARRWAIKHISVAKTIDDQWQYTEMLIKARLNALSYQCVQKVIKLTQQMIQWSQAALDQLALLLVRPRVSLVEITAEEERAKLSDLDAYHVSLVTPQLKLDGDANSVLLGEPIRVRWRAPSTRTEKDWIGIYPVEVNPSPIGTTASSHALWQWVPSDTEVTEGEMVFERERLPFFAGTYELRYHRNGKYTVLARSEPFVITGKL